MGFIGGLLGGGGSGASLAPVRDEVTHQDIAWTQEHGQAGLNMQRQFAEALMGLNGAQNPELQRQLQNINQSQDLANQLQGMTQGKGPNPAMAQLAQSTGQNVANQAALMAGQRGTSANAGLLARQIAQQGGALQQQAAGQGATLQAQQQLAAINALQNQQQLLGSLTGQRVDQQRQGLGQFSQSQAQRESNLLGAVANLNNANVQNQQSVNNANAARSQSQLDFGQGLLRGGLNSLGGIGALFGGGGGGGQAGGSTGKLAMNALPFAGGGQVPGGPHKSHVANYLHGKAMPMNRGSIVPGKAEVSGDSLKNDKVPAMLSPGEIVIPRSVAKHPNAPEEAMKFVEAVLAKNRMRK